MPQALKENVELQVEESPSLHSDMHVCKSCGFSFRGNFCNECGEKVLVAQDRTFRSFLSNFQLAFALTDNKFIKTFWMVITKPGLLAKHYVDGRRVNFMRPLQLFFILNLVYFLFPVLQLFNRSLYSQMYLHLHGPLVRLMVRSEIGTDPLVMEGYTLMYNDKSKSLAKILIIAFVFLACIPMSLIYRKRNRHFTDHMALSVEFTTFNLAINAVGLSLFLMALSKIFHFSHSGWERYLDDSAITIIFLMTNSFFLFAAGRTFYGQTGFKLLFKVVLGLVGLVFALEAYWFLLFLITFWTL